MARTGVYLEEGGPDLVSHLKNNISHLVSGSGLPSNGGSCERWCHIYCIYTKNLIDPVLEPKHGLFLSKQRSHGF